MDSSPFGSNIVSNNGTHCVVLDCVRAVGTNVCGISTEIHLRRQVGDKPFRNVNLYFGSNDRSTNASVYSVLNEV